MNPWRMTERELLAAWAGFASFLVLMGSQRLLLEHDTHAAPTPAAVEGVALVLALTLGAFALALLLARAISGAWRGAAQGLLGVCLAGSALPGLLWEPSAESWLAAVVLALGGALVATAGRVSTESA